MDTLLTQLTQRFTRTHLTPEERLAVRGNILRHMKDHPVNVREGAGIRHHRSQNSLFSQLSKKTIMMIGLIVALLLSGSVSYAAEGSLPGDTLYPIKTEVNERVMGALALSDEAEAHLEAKLAAKRLDEAEKLAKKGKLDAQASAEIENRFENHADRSKEHIARLEAVSKFDAAAKANADFEAAIAAHQAILEKFLAQDSASSTNPMKGLIIEVRKESKERGEDRAELEFKIHGESAVRTASSSDVGDDDGDDNGGSGDREIKGRDSLETRFENGDIPNEDDKRVEGGEHDGSATIDSSVNLEDDGINLKTSGKGEIAL